MATATRHRYSETNVSARYFYTLSGDQWCGGGAVIRSNCRANARGPISLRRSLHAVRCALRVALDATP